MTSIRHRPALLDFGIRTILLFVALIALTTTQFTPSLWATPAVAEMALTAQTPEPLCPGGIIEYTVTLRNTASAGDLLTAQILASIPAHTTYVNDSATNGAAFDPSKNEVAWDGRIGPGQAASVLFAVQMMANVPNGTAIVGEATGSLSDPAGGSSSDTARHTATVNCPAATATPTPTPPVIVDPPTATPTPTSLPITLPTNTPTPTATPTLPVITLPTNTPTSPVIIQPPTPTPTPYIYDIRITGMEITQGTQNLANQMPLIADRRTIVRVYVEEATGKDLSNVKARLQGRRMVTAQGSPVNQDLGTIFPQNAPTVLGAGSNRLGLGDSFWFYLPLSWRNGTVIFTAQVDYENAFNEVNLGNNQSQISLSFRAAQPLNVLFFPMRVHDGGKNGPVRIYYCQDDPLCDDLYLNALRRHPISQMNVWFAEEPLEATFGKWHSDDEDLLSQMLKKLEWVRFWHKNPPASNLHYYGTVHPDLDTKAGLGRNPGWVVASHMLYEVSNSSPWWIPRGNTVAHELGHNRGLKHIACADGVAGDADNPPDGVADEIAGGKVDSDYPWAFPNCRIASVDTAGYFGMDVYYGVWGMGAPAIISNDPAAAQPNRGWPMMSYQSLRWISPWEYCKLMSTYGVPCTLNWGTRAAQVGPLLPTAAQLAIRDLQAAAEHLLIGGEIDVTAQTAALSPGYRQTDLAPSQIAMGVEWIEANVAYQEGGDWVLTLEDGAGTVLVSRLLNDEEARHSHAGENMVEHPDTLGFFTFVELLPFSAQAQWVRVRHAGTVVAERAVSNNAPTVTLLAPNSGTLAAGSLISWEASDVDGDDLVYTVLYSHDGGNAWKPLATDIQTTTLEITPGLLHDIPGGGAGVIKVVASDGVNTGEDVSDQPLIAPNTPPDLMLTNSGETIYIQPGRLLILEGSATDMEDGVLGDASLGWHSSRDGALGTGRELATSALSEGTHTITLTARDSQTAESQATLTVIVREIKLYLPAIVRP